MSPSAIAFVPARGGSERVPGKNVRPLAGHPLLAYAIAAAGESGCFERVIVSTDREETAEIAREYGAEVPFLRPPELATSTSPDIEWIEHALGMIIPRPELLAIVRPTSPFRTGETIRRAMRQLLDAPHADSIRAVERCTQHPGKMWRIEGTGEPMTPLLDQSHLTVKWHARQYPDLPEVYVQNAALEIARTEAVLRTGTREGEVILPFLTTGHEGLNIDYEADWSRAEALVASGEAVLPSPIAHATRVASSRRSA